MVREATVRFHQSILNVFGNDKSEITSTLAVGFVVCLLVYWWITRKRYNLPPGPRGVPILGYLPFLGQEPHRDFDGLSKQYGNIFGLYLGRVYMVLLSDYNEVKEALNQPAILGRPSNQLDFTPDGAGLTTTNSTEWIEQKRFTLRSMRNIGLGGSKWETMIQEELDGLLKSIEKNNGVPLNYDKIFALSISNNITMLVFGKHFRESEPARKLVDNVVKTTIDSMPITLLRNFFPVLANFLAKFGIGGQNKDLHKLFAEFTIFLKNETEERKKLFMTEETELFVDGYLKEIQNNISNNLNNTFNERNLRGNILSLLVASTDTTTASIMWLLIAMAKFQNIQEKVYRELTAVLDKDGRAKYNERNKLPYTYAVTLECSRWATISPLSLARLAMEDTKIGDYDIPKGTLIMPNFWSIHKSSKYWTEPEEFIPERFLTEDGQLMSGNLEGFIPFSYGKRNCPGEAVAKITIFQYFAGIMQKFKVLPPVGQSVKLAAKLGVTSRPVDQELRIVSRE